MAAKTFHTPIRQHGSRNHLAMATKPPPISIYSLHSNNAIQLTLYINQCIQLWWSDQIQSCTLHLHNKYSFEYSHSVHFITLTVEQIVQFCNDFVQNDIHFVRLLKGLQKNRPFRIQTNYHHFNTRHVQYTDHCSGHIQIPDFFRCPYSDHHKFFYISIDCFIT